ncbi:MAG: hypothetical protein ACTSSG_06610 [Candidatus Heimdallarchaeaceae archaeon]
MPAFELDPEKKLMAKVQESFEKETEDIEDVIGKEEYSKAYVSELQERNRILLEALRKVKLLVERLLVQNKGLKKRVELLEKEYKEQNSKGVKIVSIARYKEMQNNANELARSLPKLIKLIKLLNQENKLLKDKYSALENEFEDLINERDDLKEKIVLLNERNQKEVLTELTELFPSEELATKVAKSISSATSKEEAILANGANAETKVIAEAAKGTVHTFEDQARSDLQAVAGFSNEQITKLVDLVMEINKKIENLSGTMVVASPTKRKGKLDLDLSDAITEGEIEKGEEPPERPDLEEVLDDILISG